MPEISTLDVECTQNSWTFWTKYESETYSLVLESIDGNQAEGVERVNLVPLFLHTETLCAQNVYVYVNERSG